MENTIPLTTHQPKRLSDKYRNSITKEQAHSLKEHIKQMRSEWDS